MKDIKIHNKKSRNIIIKLLIGYLLANLTIFSYGQNTYIDSLKQSIKKSIEKSEYNKSHVKAAIIITDYYSKVSMDSAKRYGLIGYDISMNIKNDTGIAMALNAIGMMYQICGYYDSAFPYLDSSLAMFAHIGDTTGMVFVKNNMAVAMMRTGNYTESLKYYQENLSIAKGKNELENMILAYNNMGNMYFDWKKYKQALDNYHLALGVLVELNEEERTGPVFNNIGETFFGLNKMDSALFYFDKALSINNKYGKKRSILISMTNIGNLHFVDNNYRKALEVYNVALQISESIPDEVNIALINVKIGVVYTALGSYPLAHKHLVKGLKMSLENDMINGVLEAYRGLVDYAKGINDAQLVYDYGNKYINLKDSLFNEKSLSKISELETKFKTVEKEKEIVVLKSEQQVKDMEIQLQKNLKYSLVVLLLVLILTSLLLFNRYKLKKDKEKSEVEKARLKIEQRLLHSQMNPHFIFNSLNSINSFIGEKNTIEAQTYLSKFARLMRLILENSRKIMVALEDEINALRLNLELEQLRFDGRFDFAIIIDDNIDAEDVYLPPMLIQPFVENAILHGIKGKEGKGLITLRITAEKEILKCIVEDNGVGRKESMKVGNKNKNHVSIGTQVTIERLEILKHEKSEKAGMEIIDLVDEFGNGTGTRVLLHIPYEEEW